MLSNKLGGRSEVLKTPFLEVLGHLITKFDEDEKAIEKEHTEYYMNFIAMLNSSPQNEKQAKQTEKFMKEIKPQLDRKRKDQQSSGEDIKNKYQWPERVRKKIEARNAENKK